MLSAMRALRFRVDGRTLAMDLGWIHEICPLVRLKEVPGVPSWLAGLMDHHGQLVPVVDASLLMGGPGVAQVLGARLILVHGADHDAADARVATFALRVHAVEGVADLDRGASWTTSGGLPGMPFLGEVTGDGTGSVHLLEPARLAALHASLLQGPAVLATSRATVRP
jgi:chemotaxis-related protein WspB